MSFFQRIIDEHALGRRARDAARQERSVLCTICCDARLDLSKQRERITAGCKHALRTVCDSCVQRTISAEIQEKGTLVMKCPQAECGATMEHADVQRMAPARLFERFDQLVLRRMLERDPEFCWCSAPRCGSGQLHAGGEDCPIVRCYYCKSLTCFRHRCAWHRGRSCEEYNADAARSDEVALLQHLDDIHTKRCPSCGHGIQKKSGCDHMTCHPPAGCGHNFCWLCLAPYDGPDGIRSKGNSGHQRTCRHYFSD